MRRHLAVVVAAALSVTAGQVPAAAATPDVWGQAAAHATGDFFNPGETRLTPAVAGKVKPRWTVPLAEAKCATRAVPLVGANRLVTAASYRISGYDASTGALAWQTPATTKKTSISLAAIVGTRLVAQSRDCRSGRTFLAAHDVTTGKVVYSKRIPETMYNMVVDQGIVVGGVWDATISKYAVRAYRIADGSRVWAREGSIGGETLSASGKVLVVGDTSTTAVDVTTGKSAWPAGTGCYTPIGASPDGSKFYMRCDPDGLIRSVSAATGAVLKTFPSHGATFGFATDGERIYLHSFAGAMLAISADDGRKLWSAPFPEDAPIRFAIGGGVVYGWRDKDRPLAAFEARTGRPIPLPAATTGLQCEPIVANGRLYGRTESTVITYAP
ncbi:outer membrane protein assembly factor BamB family protein [Paractinoplanes lichenicola]|uniref:PQQ-binding-like beta-propeller repeat protein n=1 Tax=Paractinoplanes lichenicola TaxID=2802976 RepID=A0ABS1VN37_9ACTN|nr:PQQ-binding-like beta-propeller repeat protein [Actinoplanes lichenicola]MBL7255891.1 PQQ-binding-like beta-propeller repeat protein [Actinoplanes lichenicola]